jgi:glycosyltransferase involved in cell wall biosynthesis
MAEPLRVGVDLSILRHPHAGSARWALGLHRALRERDDLDLVAWLGPPRLRRGGLLRKVGNLLRERAWYDLLVPRLARRGGVDVLLMPVNLSARTRSVPQVVSILDVNFLTQAGTYDAGYAAYATRAFRRSAHQATLLTTISQFSRAEIAEHLEADAERIRVVYPGLHPAPDVAPAPAPIPEPYALYVGASEPHKNLALLIEAWRGTSPGGLRLAMVGQPGRDHERLRRLVSELSGRAVLVGAVSSRELERWYAGARVFCFPSRTEGFGYPPLEAMQRRVPVVAAAAGALPEVLDDAARFHDPDDAAAVREHVASLAEPGREREEQIERGLGVAARYTWPEAGAAMAGLLGQAARR